MPPSSENRWRGWIQLLLGLALTLLFFYMMAPFLVAILIAAVTAILCHPIYLRLSRKLPGWLAALTVTLGVTVGILFPIGFVLLTASHRILGFIGEMRLPQSGNLQSLVHHPLISKGLGLLTRFFPVDRDWVQGQALNIFESMLEMISRGIGSFLAGMPGLVLGFFVVVMTVFFFLVDGAKFLRFLSSLSPMQADRSRDLYATFESSCRGVVLGLVVSAIVQGVLVLIFFSVTGIPNAFLLGVLAMVMGMVPVVGNAPITIGGAIYHFLSGHTAMGIVMVVAIVLIGAVDNVVRPMVMKGASEMHPLLALLSAFGATHLLGPTGIFLGPVIAAVFVSFLRIIALEIRRENLNLGGSGPISTDTL